LKALDTLHSIAWRRPCNSPSKPAPKPSARSTRLHARIGQGDSLGLLTRTLESGSVGEQQTALASLAKLPSGRGHTLGQWLDKLIAGQAPKEIQLDISKPAPIGIRDAQGQVPKNIWSAAEGRSVARYSEALYGGNVQKPEVSMKNRRRNACLPQVGAPKGGEAGPNLSDSANGSRASTSSNPLSIPTRDRARIRERISR